MSDDPCSNLYQFELQAGQCSAVHLLCKNKTRLDLASIILHVPLGECGLKTFALIEHKKQSFSGSTRTQNALVGHRMRFVHGIQVLHDLVAER